MIKMHGETVRNRLSSDFRIHKLEKIGGMEAKKKYPARQCKVCAAHKKQSETRNILYILRCSASQRIFFLRNTVQ